ncbi:MAG: DUF3192 domain-containing protein [Gammaproteobacteria bacterium]|nr:DUF3192 domain-containing protein [Gammaproteobacteria bacterium]
MEAGVTSDEAIARLGKPDFHDSITDEVDILSWRTQSIQTDGATARNETTPLVFYRGELLNSRAPK